MTGAMGGQATESTGPGVAVNLVHCTCDLGQTASFSGPERLR